MAQQPAEYYDAHFATQAAYHSTYRDSFYFPLWVQVEFLLREHKGKSILDIGCGPGQFAGYLHDLEYPHYRGVDFSPKAIELAREMCDYPFEVGDALTGDMYQEPYDVAMALEVLEHLNEDHKVIHNIKPGTYCIFSVPNFDDPGHVRWFRSFYQVRKRYYRLIDIKSMHFINNIYLFAGERSDFQPNIFQRILKTRSPITLGSLWARIWHRAVHSLKIKHAK